MHTENVLAGFLPTGDNMQERLSRARTDKQAQAVAGDDMAHMARVAGRDEDEARKKAGKTLPHNRILTDLHPHPDRPPARQGGARVHIQVSSPAHA